MRIVVLEDGHGLKKGLIEVADEIARVLISKGLAVKEKSIDEDAHDALELAKNRDQAE